MTQATVPARSGGRTVCVTESFSRYRFDAEAVSARTDTPDLMRLFQDEALLAEGYAATQESRDAIHEDLFAASLRSMPE